MGETRTFSDPGLTVTQVCFDHAVTLLVANDSVSYRIRIEGAMHVGRHRIDPGRWPIDAAPIVALIHEPVVCIEADDLQLSVCTRQDILTVARADEFIAWMLAGPDGLKLWG